MRYVWAVAIALLLLTGCGFLDVPTPKATAEQLRVMRLCEDEAKRQQVPSDHYRTWYDACQSGGYKMIESGQPRR